MLSRIKRVPVVTWVQDLWPQSLQVTGYVRNQRVLGAVAAVVRWIYRRCDLLLAQSKSFVPVIQAMAGNTPVLYLPNPGAQEGQAVAAAVHALRLGEGFNIVFAGNLGSVQALDTVLDAAELLRDTPDVRFTLVGSGSRSAWLASEIERRGLRHVALPGRFEASAMPAIYAQADALLVSLNKSDILSQTIPSKVQSYLAAGRPLLASLDGEGAQVVRDANAGFATPAEDAPALAAAVRSLRSCTPAQRLEMGLRAQQFYRAHFEPHEVARTLQAQLRSAIKHHSAPGDNT